MKRIAVLWHRSSTGHAPFHASYVIELLASEWQKMGFDVQMLSGTGNMRSADVLIPHLDLTIIPHDYCMFMEQYPRVINKDVLDISKSRISSNLLHKNDSYGGPVIVKTDRNYGGLPEAHLGIDSDRDRLDLSSVFEKVATKAWKKLTGRVPWKYVRYLKTSEYPLFPSIKAVPKGVFKNKSLVVEKYCPEREDNNYIVRYCYFFGDREISFLLRSSERNVKISNAFQIEEVPTPQEIHLIRRKMGFEFGKFDYIINGGKVVLFDVNRTPSCSYLSLEQGRPMWSLARRLADGIWSIVDC